MASDNPGIPSVFWYVSSLCMLMITVVLLIIAWRSNNISIEVASAKISLSSALTSIKDAKDTLQKESDRLRIEKESFEKKYGEAIDRLSEKQTNGGKSKSSDELAPDPLKSKTKKVTPEEVQKFLNKYRAIIEEKDTFHNSFARSLHDMNSKIAQTENYIQSIK